MKLFRRRIVAGLLAVIMTVSSLQYSAYEVYAEEAAEETSGVIAAAEEIEEESGTETIEGIQEESDPEIAEGSDEEKGSENTEESEEENKSDVVGSIEGDSDEQTDSEQPDTNVPDNEDALELGGGTEESTSGNPKEENADIITVEAKFEGVYQFGDAPLGKTSESDELMAMSLESRAKEVNGMTIDEYLYEEALKRKLEIDILQYGITEDQFGPIATGLLNEHPDLYFIQDGVGYSYSPDTMIVDKVYFSYADGLDDAAFKWETYEALSRVDDNMSDLQKAIILHDYIVANCEYDQDRLDDKSIPRISYTAYGILVEHIAVCEGYSLAYKYLLDLVGIKSYIVTSIDMSHQWNLIELDGEYYHVDTTWDDPIRDIIGRAHHKYMFLSDKALSTATTTATGGPTDRREHPAWVVTSGSDIVSYKATDTKYDNAFWANIRSPLVLAGDNWDDCYYMYYNTSLRGGQIIKASLKDIDNMGTSIPKVNTGFWPIWGNDYVGYTEGYSGLFQYNGRLYYNNARRILSVAFESGDVTVEFIPPDVESKVGYVYGCTLRQGKVLYSVHQSPYPTARETLLEADINNIETEKPREIPVEKIELNTDTLTLKVGKATKLKAKVTPAYATDTAVTWESSDTSVAEVEAGMVTAISVGNCTITATAGGWEAVCEVTVTPPDIAQGTSGNISWAIDAYGKLTAEGSGDFTDTGSNPYYNYDRAPWYDDRLSITEAEISITDMNDASYLFYGCENLQSVDLSGFDTSKVTDMSSMFYGCRALSDVDVSGLKTSEVTDMSYMFFSCWKITSVDVSRFDTSNVTDMASMFGACSKLQSVDVSRFDTSKVTNMAGMFAQCSALKSLDVSNFETSKVTDMSDMFSVVYDLTSLDVSNFDTGNVTNMAYMFNGCIDLKTLDVSNFDTGKVTDMNHMFDGCLNLKTLDVSRFDTSNVTDMNEMFDGCNGLQSLDVSSFDTSKVTDMSGMFMGCKGLQNLDISSFNTSNVTDMENMFQGCSGLQSLDVSNFDTGKVTDMSRMFVYCITLQSLDLSSFDTGKVTDMSYMFSESNGLQSLNLSSFNVSAVTNIENVFNECTALSTIYTPYNLSLSVELPVADPDDIWYSSSGSISELPQLIDYSIIITKNRKPAVNYVSVSKSKTVYKCGETINTDDITVTYCDENGKVTKVTDYTTNAADIDTSAVGTKDLIITYKGLDYKVSITIIIDPYITVTKAKTLYDFDEELDLSDLTVTYYDKMGVASTVTEYTTNAADIDTSILGKKRLIVTYNGLTAEIELTVVYVLKNEAVDITLPGDNYIYDGLPKTPVPTVLLNGTTLTEGKDYTVTYEDNINAGEDAKVIITGQDDYRGSITKLFTIGKADVTITARNKTIAKGAPLPKDKDYKYDTEGLVGNDTLITPPTLRCEIENTDSLGTYPIVPEGADAGPNYEITYHSGTLTVVSERNEYNVTFDYADTEVDVQWKNSKDSSAEWQKTPEGTIGKGDPLIFTVDVSEDAKETRKIAAVKVEIGYNDLGNIIDEEDYVSVGADGLRTYTIPTGEIDDDIIITVETKPLYENYVITFEENDKVYGIKVYEGTNDTETVFTEAKKTVSVSERDGITVKVKAVDRYKITGITVASGQKNNSFPALKTGLNEDGWYTFSIGKVTEATTVTIETAIDENKAHNLILALGAGSTPDENAYTVKFFKDNDIDFDEGIDAAKEYSHADGMITTLTDSFYVVVSPAKGYTLGEITDDADNTNVTVGDLLDAEGADSAGITDFNADTDKAFLITYTGEGAYLTLTVSITEIKAEEVTLDRTELTMFNGATQTLTMTVTPSDFTDKVTWKSSNTSIVTVTDAGEVTAKKVGTATVTVTVGKVSASCKVTVKDSVTSALSAVEKLTDNDIKALDQNLPTVSSRISADKYTVNSDTIKVSGTVKYVYGCTGYLGYEDGMTHSGYFLAMKLRVANPELFKEEGHLTICYPAENGTREEKVYRKGDLAADGNDGFVNVILNVTEANSDITIKIDYDGEENPQCVETIYKLDLSGLAREAKSNSVGGAKEIPAYGIESSSPAITVSSDGTDIKASYDVVAFSSNVELPNDDGAGSVSGNYVAQPVSGNYIVLQLNMPDAVEGTAMAEPIAVTGVDGDGEVLYIEDEDESFVRFVMHVTGSFTKDFTIKWGGDHPYAFVQKLTVSVPESCILESLNEAALLPGSIAFNGLVTTMYVGQSQDVSITFQKKYEQDGIRVYYTSSDSSVISVNRITGVTRALKAGTANITVTAMDGGGNTISKTAKVTVKALTAPASVKVSNIKDTSASVSWKANTTGQYMEVYAIPYNSAKLGTKAAEWKTAVENTMQSAGMDEKTLDSLDKEKGKKEELLSRLADSQGTGSWQADYVTSDKTSLTIEGLQAKTDYIFYVRNTSVTEASTMAFSGAVSSKATTKSEIFASIKVTLMRGSETVEPNADGIYEINEDYLNRLEGAGETLTVKYALLDADQNERAGIVFTSPKFNSSNTNIVKLTAVNNTATATLKVGTQVGDARIYVTGKDSSGTARESESIMVRVIRKPTGLTKKTTTLTIGQSISIKELIGTNLKGTMEGMDLSNIGFEDALEQIKEKECFAVTYPDGSGLDEQGSPYAIDAVITAVKPSGNNININFKMINSTSSAAATITVKELAAPAISKVTVRDTSATVQFKPSATVTEIKEGYYYTLNITDTVTKESIQGLRKGDPYQYTCAFRPDAVNPGTVWTCEIGGLSSNKAYEVEITAHCDLAGHTNEKKSSKKKFTTSKPLLIPGGSIDVNYISLDDLRKEPYNTGTPIVFKDEAGNDIEIVLENNGTYVFMAQVSNLARALETDKLKWAISSGDKKAGSIKASSSTFEMQLTTTKVGTFTVTATSTVTKEALATFVVKVIPYQSGAGNTNSAGSGLPIAYLPEIDTGLLFRIKREDAA